ncbi:MAG: hypothetical protein LBP19_04230 [Treponema sp.]|jgi:site-specific DNA-adenine methylase|nr:hypothetical protein [Treponema sp.]
MVYLARTPSLYCDLPYVGVNQEHYDGYTQDDFDNLLKLLETINGKFLVSSYRNASLREYTKRNGGIRRWSLRRCQR